VSTARALLLALCVAVPAVAEDTQSACADSVRPLLANELGIDALEPIGQGGNIVAETCKAWPYNHRLLLSAIAYDAGVEFEKQLLVAIVDSAAQQVVASYRKPIAEDALTEVGPSSLVLDTARYQLGKDVRAFGLRFNSAALGASCGEANWNEELTLLVPEGKQLRPVLNLFLYQQQSIRGCLSTQSADAIWQDANITLAVEPTATHGFHDLRATAAITYHSNGAPLEDRKDHVEQLKLHYNGSAYEIGKDAPWWAGYW
jgi:hypothetical protein